ncbi:MAG: helix-turn-helix transcriptional regulator [Actinobacteria bacterium]|nr:helix-turn-helix transcriptional regulator [Actinomycetota bacterium]
MAKASTPIDTRFDIVDDLLDGVDVSDDQMARINAHLARLLADDDVLRAIRIECGIAQKAVAADLGVTASAIAQLEARSLDTVQLGTVRRYFEALGYELTVSVAPLETSPRHNSS